MINWAAIGSIILPNTGGWAGALGMSGQVKNQSGTAWYQGLNKPSWTPPNWLFGPAWTALYSGMGYASYLVYKDCGGFTESAVVPLSLYGGQLALNWAWTPIFFKYHNLPLAAMEIAVLDVAAAACCLAFYQVNPLAGQLLLPYLAWLSYATCLAFSVWSRNPKAIKKN